MGDDRNVDVDGTTGEEVWRDDAAPTSPSDLDIESDLESDDLEESDEDDIGSGAGYGNNNDVRPNPD